ncbi:hypothetical protein CapIbe_019011 [Capra ibex]
MLVTSEEPQPQRGRAGPGAHQRQRQRQHLARGAGAGLPHLERGLRTAQETELNFITQSPEAARHGPHFPNPDAFHLTRRRGGEPPPLTM